MKYHKTISVLLTITTVIILISGILVYGSYSASQRARERKYTSLSGSLVPHDYLNRVDHIVQRLETEKYGLAYAPWNRLMMHGFLASSISSIIRTYPEDQSFRSHGIEIINASYRIVDSEIIQSSFSQTGTRIPYGIIYQAGRLKILEQLAFLDSQHYQDIFLSECDKIANLLKDEPHLTAESYTGWGWYVDNADIYHALWSANKIREKEGQAKKHTKLIKGWIKEITTHTGSMGLPLAEAYRPGDTNDNENQVRGSATGWLLWDIYDIDPDLAKKFFTSFEREFADTWGKYTLIRDIPRGEKKINNVFDGPKLGPYSSSATILSVPIFRTLGEYDKSDGLLRSFDTILIAPGLNASNPDWLFGGSLLLDILRLWAEVAKPL